MSDLEKAAAAKTKGNTHFSAGEFKEAVAAYSEGIALNPTEHTLYSNRSGAYASLGEFQQALEDAEQCIKIAPSFTKAYSRKGLALFKLGKLDEAKAAYEAGLKVDPNDEKLKEGLNDIRSTQSQNPMAKLFSDQMWIKLQMDPTTREYLKDEAFVEKLRSLQRDPQAINSVLGGGPDRDPRLMTAVAVILGLPSGSFKQKPGEDGDEQRDENNDRDGDKEDGDKDDGDKDDGDTPMQAEKEEPKPAKKVKSEEKKAAKKELSTEEKEDLEKKKEAEKEKDLGNAAYKKRDFSKALVHYGKASEIDKKGIVYEINSAAVHFEQKEYDKCIEVCRAAIERGREQKIADGKTIAKAYLRMGNAYAKQDKFKEAIEAYNKGLVEDYNEPLRAAVKKCETAKKKKDAEAYIDPEKSEEHKKKGNELFDKAKWTEAIEEYTEALRRDPKNYKIYSNRAACYTKLMDWQRALDDCETCLKLEPTFVKIYIRKAKIQHFLKQYHKALETYSKGLDLDPECGELLEGKRETLNMVNVENSTGKVDPRRRAEALKDPEIQAILRDPTIDKVLSDLQQDPTSAQGVLRDPIIAAKLEKLIAAGVLQAR